MKYVETTKEEALRIAHHWGLEYEVEELMNQGLSPCEALYEWDLPVSLEEFQEYNEEQVI